ncbi:MAG: extensin family protein [Deltaproteobacteria bacterium]|nr:extensin family protein [Deltaproteobacteria bacterium]
MVNRTLCGLSMVMTLAACDDDPRSTNSLVQHRSPLPDVVADALADVADAEDTQSIRPDTTTPPTDATLTDSQVAGDTGSPDTWVAPDTSTPDTSGPNVPTGPANINDDWIGGACAGAGDCPYEGGTCLTSGDGWPGGLCSEACTRFCPDQAGAATTFCIDGGEVGESGGVCVMKCDFGESPTGCRDGYACVAQRRFNEPAVMAYVCLPGEGELEVSSCIEELIAKGIGFELASNPMDTPDGGDPGDVCDVLDPIYVDPIIDGVRIRPMDFDNEPRRMLVQCPVALALWETVQLAKARGVTDIVHYGTYNCRYISGTSTLSQHAYANAIDLAGFKTASGAEYTVLGDWDKCDATPEAPGGQLLYGLAHEMHDDAIWNEILTPEYNAAHADHLHVDLTEGAYFLSDCQ